MTPRTRGLVILGTILLVAGVVGAQLPDGSGAVLRPEDHDHVRKALAAHGWAAPTALALHNDVVVIDVEIDDTVPVAQRRAFAEARLLAIREELLVDGYKNYRLNVNGPSPGTGLVRRYGAVRIVGESGELEWMTP